MMKPMPISPELINSAEIIAEVSGVELSLDALEGVVGGAGWAAGTGPTQIVSPGNAKLGIHATGVAPGSSWSPTPSLPRPAWGH
ncbi:hypothetical protein [Methylobacterium nonmethylotrophicum]|uniref:Uncharacterized protein n=1 Tax=Methylobacterium nonmethylotrophicum TaxID=1141884 RepID=A0A4Z0NFZ5_9HYPH|nr:hypothetical protein [Methylobacterium nonmethylotrophicum]TGD94863.1 hypothetical protein EU555_30905 [Methylobacterium nonmethylotrophicum]